MPRTWLLGLVYLLASGPLSPARAQEQDPSPAQPEPSDEGPAVAAPADVVATTPPRVVRSVEPRYPESHASIGIEPTVMLHVTVDVDGSVLEAHVEHPGDPEIDAAALEAVRQWRFEPAQRGGEPVRTRVRVAVRVRAPRPEAPLLPQPAPHGSDAPPPPPPQAGATASRGDAEQPAAHALPGSEPERPEHAFVARATADPARESRRPRVAASDVELDRAVLEAAPHRDASAMLESAPGVYVARPEGEAVAQQVFLRGFDAEHGQDIELTTLGMSLNQPSHLHGQGYADLGFLIPEVVRALRVTEGVYDPRQGDFATAGSIDFELGVERRGLRVQTTYGSFETFRALLLWAPPGEREDTFGAAQYRSTGGFGRNRAGQSAGGLAQIVVGDERLRGRVHGSVWAARSQLAGILRRDDVEAGRVGFLDVYPDPSALAQSALSARAHLGGGVEMLGDGGSLTELGGSIAWHDFRLQANYTGYTERSLVEPDWVGRGDLLEQRNEALTIGLRGRHRSARVRPFDWLHGLLEVGLSGRLDVIGQAQNLLEAPQNQTWDRRVDADVRGIDVGGWVDLDVGITEYVRVRGGLRADVLFYDVDDRLGNAIPAFRRERYIVGFRRSAAGVAIGPRVAVEVTPVPELALSVAYGQGYRSPQARQLQDGERAPYATVQSGDLGVRWVMGRRRELIVRAAGYVTTVDDDTAFDPRQGRLERLGPTTRTGGALHVEARPWSWLVGSASVTYVRATLDAPPPPSIEDPQPPYRPGEALPYVPPWVVRADLGVGERLFDLLGTPLSGRLGVGFSFLSPRPLPYGLYAEPVSLLDVGASLRWSALDVGVEIFNVTDARYAATEYSYASSWNRGAVGSRLPARHFAAGPPLTVQVTLGVTL